MPYLLRFESALMHYGLTAPGVPHAASVSGFRLSESLTEPNEQEFREAGIGDYRLAVECEVSTQVELWETRPRARSLADELNIAWCYAYGMPLRACTVQSDVAPAGWTGNLEDVQRDIVNEASGIHRESRMVSRRSWWFARLPLEPVLDVRDKFMKGPAVLRALMNLHVQALRAEVGITAPLLAKAMEAVGAYFAVRSGGTTRNDGIQRAMHRLGPGSALTKPVDWIFDIASERFELCHIWGSASPGATVHPRLTCEELRQFVTNADLVIRAFVCDQLGVDVPTIHSGNPPRVGRWESGQLRFDDEPES